MCIISHVMLRITIFNTVLILSQWGPTLLVASVVRNRFPLPFRSPTRISCSFLHVVHPHQILCEFPEQSRISDALGEVVCHIVLRRNVAKHYLSRLNFLVEPEIFHVDVTGALCRAVSVLSCDRALIVFVHHYWPR